MATKKPTGLCGTVGFDWGGLRCLAAVAAAEELDQALQSDAVIDVAVPSHDTLPTLIKAGRLQPLDLSLLPNRQHLDKAILSKLAAYDPQNRYAVPYLWGTVGLAVNVPQAEAALGGPVPNSWNLLFDPAMSGKLASCGIAMIDSSSEALAVLLNYQGRNLAHSSPKQLKRAGLDYHEYAQVQVHPDLATALAVLAPKRLFAFSTRGQIRHDMPAYADGDAFLFGPETRGLPDEVLDAIPEAQRLRLPMRPGNRSLNLSNSVAVAVFEAWRQHGFAGGA